MKSVDEYRVVLPTEWRRADLAGAMEKLDGMSQREIYLEDSVGKTIRKWKREGAIEQTPRGMTFWRFVERAAKSGAVATQPTTERRDAMPAAQVEMEL